MSICWHCPFGDTDSAGWFKGQALFQGEEGRRRRENPRRVEVEEDGWRRSGGFGEGGARRLHMLSPIVPVFVVSTVNVHGTVHRLWRHTAQAGVRIVVTNDVRRPQHVSDVIEFCSPSSGSGDAGVSKVDVVARAYPFDGSVPNEARGHKRITTSESSLTTWAGNRPNMRSSRSNRSPRMLHLDNAFLREKNILSWPFSPC